MDKVVQLAAGANNVAICWGPVLGAKVVKYRSAVLLGSVCQLVGVLAFGPRTYTICGGFLSPKFVFNTQPDLMLYATMWTAITPAVWQLLAIRRQILVPTYLGTGTSWSLLVPACTAAAGRGHILLSVECLQLPAPWEPPWSTLGRL